MPVFTRNVRWILKRMYKNTVLSIDRNFMPFFASVSLWPIAVYTVHVDTSITRGSSMVWCLVVFALGQVLLGQNLANIKCVWFSQAKKGKKTDFLLSEHIQESWEQIKHSRLNFQDRINVDTDSESLKDSNMCSQVKNLWKVPPWVWKLQLK